MDSMPDFLALTEGRPADEVEFALAVAAAVAQHMDQHKEHQMADTSADYGHAQAEQERRRGERQGAAVLAGLADLARREALGLDVAAQREALGLDGKGR